MHFFSGHDLLGLEAGRELNSCGYCSSREGGACAHRQTRVGRSLKGPWHPDPRVCGVFFAQ